MDDLDVRELSTHRQQKRDFRHEDWIEQRLMWWGAWSAETIPQLEPSRSMFSGIPSASVQHIPEYWRIRAVDTINRAVWELDRIERLICVYRYIYLQNRQIINNLLGISQRTHSRKLNKAKQKVKKYVRMRQNYPNFAKIDKKLSLV